MQLQGPYLDDTACAVYLDRPHESQVHPGNQQPQQAQREDESQARELLEEVQAGDYVADKN